MKLISTIYFLFLLPFLGNGQSSTSKSFDPNKDLLLLHLDCKTDVDDVHTLAAFVTLLSHPDMPKINFHVVTGTYGIQEGLYVPPNPLFELALDDKDWSDAHADRNQAVQRVAKLATNTLKNGGDIWIADGGQSDFSAMLVKMVEREIPGLDIPDRIHIVQHSDWNEEVTSPQALAFVKEATDYHKIPDGNAVGNGTPGFRTPKFDGWKTMLSDEELLKIWELALEIGLEFNAKEGRYNNEAVESGGVDFSDLSEVCYILGLEDIKDTQEFFKRYGR
ncbi:hypothetical protein [Algoriphagus sediminis]|uniref:DUF1593 domain-containing protein n=1 Tax=Algoriphagus sediminis TaxID=3057113 RepID=A0ABT7YFD7_9BACT|nr:hypothetical protein [Algoriphagus sediminis]MDN3205239.1 hypothetical protein [Algoriphagus sediminis]